MAIISVAFIYFLHCSLFVLKLCSKTETLQNDLTQSYTERDFWRSFRYDNATDRFERHIDIIADIDKVFVYKLEKPRDTKFSVVDELPTWLKYVDDLGIIIILPMFHVVPQKDIIFSAESNNVNKQKPKFHYTVKLQIIPITVSSQNNLVIAMTFQKNTKMLPFNGFLRLFEIIEMSYPNYRIIKKLPKRNVLIYDIGKTLPIKKGLLLSIHSDCPPGILMNMIRQLLTQKYAVLTGLRMYAAEKMKTNCTNPIKLNSYLTNGSELADYHGPNFTLTKPRKRRSPFIFSLPQMRTRIQNSIQDCQDNSQPSKKFSELSLIIKPNEFTHVILDKDLFTDEEDGNIRQLKLMLRWSSGKEITKSDWLQFSSTVQFIYTWATYDILLNQPLRGYSLQLSATDRCNVSSSIDLRLKVENNILHPPCHHFVLIVESKMDINTPYIHVLVDLVNLIRVQLNDTNLKNILVTKFTNVVGQKNIFSLLFSDQAIRCQPCDLMTVGYKLALSSNAEFVKSFEPNFKYLGLTADKRKCGGNSKPIVLCPIPYLNISKYLTTQYLLPVNTFYDAEDGFTNNLKLDIKSVRQQNTLVITIDSSIIYIYQIKKATLVSDFPFTLEATDSGGVRTILHFDVQVSMLNAIPYAKFEFNFTAFYHRLLTSGDILFTFLKRLSEYLVNEITLGKITVLSFQRTGIYPQYIQLSWTHSQFMNTGNHVILFNNLKTKLFIGTGVSSGFANFMLPFVSDMKGSYDRGNTPSPTIKPTPTVTNHLKTTINNEPPLKTSILTVIKPSTASSISPTPSRPPPGNEPKAMYAIGPFLATFCDFFIYPIPEDLFYDVNEGYTRNLNLSLKTSLHTEVDKTSWLQIDTDIQVLYGFLKVSDYVNVGGKKQWYHLVAKNSRGFETSLSFAIQLPEKLPEIFYQITMTVSKFYDSNAPDINEQLLLLLKVSTYFGEPKFSWVNILSFSRNEAENLVTFAWTNCTLSDSIACPSIAVQDLSSKIVLSNGNPNSNFARSLSPQYIIKDITVSINHNCQSSTTSVPVSSSITITTTPLILNRLAVMQIYSTTYFRYKIPFNTFYDSNDGYTPYLHLSMVNIDGTALSYKSWIQFNKAAQEIQASLYISVLQGANFRRFQFILTATNSYARSNNMIITMDCFRVTIPTGGLNVELVASEFYSSAMNNLQVLTLILQRYFQYMGAREKMEIQMFNRLTGPPGQITVVFTYNLVNSMLKCNVSAVDVLTNKLTYFGHGSNPVLIRAFLPETEIGRVEVQTFGLCSHSTPIPTSPQGPVIRYQIPLLFSETNVVFRYSIPSNAFYDANDGSTSNLKLVLLSSDRTLLSQTSWIQISSQQILTGILTRFDISGSNEKIFQYILRATNSKGSFTDMNIRITGRNTLNLNAFQITFYGQYFHPPDTSNVDILIYINQKIRYYLYGSDAQTDAGFMRFNRDNMMLSFIFQDVKLTPETCNTLYSKDIMYKLFTPRQYINPHLILAMHPQISLTSVTMNKKCDYVTPTPSVIPSPTISPNTPPRVNILIAPIIIQYGNSVFYYIDPNTFLDAEDGNTRHLQLELFTLNGGNIPKTEWLQWNSNLQMIYGLLKLSDYIHQPSTGYRYILVATDSGGLQASTTVSTVLPSYMIKYNFRFNMVLTTSYDLTLPYVNEQIQITKKIFEYIKHYKIQIITFKRVLGTNKMEIVWTLYQLPYLPCPVNMIMDILQNVLKNGNPTVGFTSTMKPEYNIIQLRVDYLDPCAFVTQSTAQPSTAIIPSTAIVLPSISVTRYPPIAINVIPILKPKSCAKFRYQIPDKAFYDPQNGFNRNLRLTLLEMDGSVLSSSSWIIFDEAAQLIIAVVKDEILEYTITHKQYKLVATNRYGLSAHQLISFELPAMVPVTHSFFLVFVLSTPQQNDVHVIKLLCDKINNYMKTINNMRIINFKRYQSGLMNIKWTTCSVETTACNYQQINGVESLFFGENSDVKSGFIQAMHPEINVGQFSFQMEGRCALSTITSITLQPSPTPSTTPPKANLPPAILKLIPLLNVSTCSVFIFHLPEDTFFDVEDGLTRNLKIKIYTEQGYNLPDSSWIMFNETTQKFTGLLSDAEEKQTDRFVYKVLAIDSGGLAIHQMLRIDVLHHTTMKNIIIDTHASLFKYTSINQLKWMVSESLSNYIIVNDPSWSGIKIHSLVVYGSQQKKINFRWSVCGFLCTLESIEKLKSIVMAQDVLKTDFVVLMKPTIIITSVSVSNSNTCTLPVTTTATVSNIQPSPTPTVNTPPIIHTPIPVLSVTRCKIFEYEIPPKTCLDHQDGYTPKLRISIQYTNGTNFGENDWIHLNPTTQKLYGILKESDIQKTLNNVFTYLFICKDKEGELVSQRLHIVLQGTSQSPQYSIKMQSYIYATSHSSHAETQLLWIKKLSSYFGDDMVGNVQIKTFEKSTVLYPQIVISWYVCSISDICNDEGKRIIAKLFTYEDSLNTAFTQNMVPEFVLISGKIESENNCRPSSTTSVIPTSSSITTNKPPTTLLNLLILKVDPCSDILYHIPANTFYDHEDGYTPNLDLRFMTYDGDKIKDTSCVKFNETTQTIYGVVVLDDIQINNKFRLVATDSRGASTETSVMIQLTDENLKASHVFFARAYLYTSSDKIKSLIELKSKISIFYGDSSSFNILFKSTNIENNYIDIEWANCSLKSSCNVKALKEIQSKILHYNTIINAEFIASLAPTFIVTFVQFSYGTLCSSVVTLSTFTSFTSAIVTPTTSILQPSPTPGFNTPPVVLNPLKFIEVPLCSSFSYRIPHNIFYDKEDGDTRRLKLDLLTFDERELPKTSWVLFVHSTQVVYGHPRVDDMKTTKSYLNYILRATDSRGSSVSTVLTLVLPPKPVVNFQLNVTIQRFFDFETPDLTAQLFLVSKICSYIGDLDVTKVLVLSFERSLDQVKLSWTNCTLRHQCQKKDVDGLLGMFITDGETNPSFQEVLNPYYEVEKVTGEILKDCSYITTTKHIKPTTSFKISSLTTTVLVSPTPTLQPNYPPRINQIISPVKITFCNSFAYHIPENVFIDEDGTTSTLRLTLYDVNGTNLSRTSWIQFNQNLQVAYGMLKIADVKSQPMNGFNFILQATDSKGLSSRTLLQFQRITDSTVLGFVIEMQIRCAFTDEYPFVNDLFQIINKISLYFHDKSPGLVKSIDFKELPDEPGLIIFQWTNCTSNFRTCPEETIKHTTNMIFEANGEVKSEFTNFFLPQYSIEKIMLTRNPLCVLPTTTTTVTPSPSPSDKPFINRYISPLTTQICSYLFYEIPSDTFYDYKDGYTRRLTLRLNFINGESIPSSYWLQFQEKEQTITGLPIRTNKQTQQPNGYLFVLTATDSDGYSVSMNIQINIRNEEHPVLQNITLNLVLNFDLQLPNPKIQNMIVQRIANFYHDKNEQYIDVIRFQKEAMFVSITWSNCSLNAAVCHKMLASWIQDYIMNTDGKCRAQFSFVFLPEFSVRDLFIQNNKSCLNDSTLSSHVTISPTKSSQALFSSAVIVPNTLISLRNVSIDVSYCGSIKYTIPDGIFYDSYDGNTKSFKYSLQYTDGVKITCQSWLQIQSNLLYGVSTQSQQNSPTQYILRAENVLGSSAETFVTLSLKEQVPNVTYKVALSFLTTLNDSVCDAELVRILIQKILVYFKNSDDRNVSVIYFSRGDLLTPSYMLWSNCSLKTDVCDFVNINQISSMLFEGNTSHPNNNLRKMLLPEFHNVSVLDEKSGPCSINKVLAVGKHPESICANVCGLFEYIIPDETFLDPEDGDTPNLIVEVVKLDRSPLPSDFWIQYNMSTKTLYGLPTEKVKLDQPKNGYSFLLVAYDTGGAAAETILRIKICGEIPRHENSVTLSYTCVRNITSVITTVIDIINRMSNLYLDGTLDSIFLIRYNSDRHRLNFTWSNCSANEIGLNSQQLTYQFILDCVNDNVTMHRDFPPIANTSSIRVSASYSKYNIYNFPPHAFYDKEDGKMDNLDLYFTYTNGTEVNQDDWIGFIREKLKLYIIPTNQTKNNLVYQYLFVAKDSRNQTTTISLFIEMFEAFPKLNYIVHAQYKSYYNTPTVATIYTFLVKMGAFFNSNSTLIVIKYQTYLNNSIMVEYGNISLITLRCQYEEVEAMTSRLLSTEGKINADLFTFMFPECLIEKVKPRKIGNCLIPPNESPKVFKSIPGFNVSSCGYLKFKIPNDTFYDKEDGWTSNLTLNLVLKMKNCWIEFEETSQTIFAMVSNEALTNQPAAGYMFTIEATDSRGSTVNTTLHIALLPFAKTSFELVVLFEILPSLNISCLKEKVVMVDKIRSYFEDTNSLSVKSVLRGADEIFMEVMFINCSMRYEPCDYIGMDSMLEKLEDSSGSVKREFYNYMLPGYMPRYLSKRRAVPCLDSSNKKPVQNASLQKPNLTACGYYQTRLASNLIIDEEDGAIHKLHVVLLNATSGFQISNTTWIYLEPETKAMSIVSSMEAAIMQPENGYQFSLDATDSRKASTSVSFSIFFDAPLRNKTFVVKENVTILKKHKSIATMLIEWQNETESLIQYGIEIISYHLIPDTNDEIHITWSICGDDTNGSRCNFSAMDKIKLEFESKRKELEIVKYGPCLNQPLYPPNATQNNVVYINPCRKFVYRLPESLFSDEKDGSTSNLFVDVVKKYPNVDIDFLFYNASSQTFHGILIMAVFQAYDYIEYEVIATDSDNLKTKTAIKFSLDQSYTRQYEILTETLFFPPIDTNLTFVEYFYDLVVSYLKLDRNGLIIYNKTKSRTANQNTQYDVSFTPCSLTGYGCQANKSARIESLLVLPSGKINFDFVSALLEIIVVRKVGINQHEICNDTEPRINQTIKELKASICNHLSYKIPDNAYADDEQGPTSSLYVTLDNANTFQWVQFNETTQTLDARPTLQYLINQPFLGYKLILTASDKAGNKVSQTVTIKIEGSAEDYNFFVSMAGKLLAYQIQNSFKLHQDLQKKIQLVTSLQFAHTSVANVTYVNEIIYFSVYDCARNKDFCQAKQNQEFLNVFMDDNNEIKANVAQFFLPEFQLLQVDRLNMSRCKTTPAEEPFITDQIPTLNLSLCQQLRYKLPDGLFMDANDGELYGKAIDFCYQNGSVVSKDNPIRYDQNLRLISAYLTQEDLQKYKYSTKWTYILKSTDSDNNTVSLPVYIKLPQQIINNYIITVKASTLLDSSLPDLVIISNFLSRMYRHFSDTVEETISIIKFSRSGNLPQRVELQWTNCTVINDECDENKTDYIYNQIYVLNDVYNPYYVDALGRFEAVDSNELKPGFTATETIITKDNVCLHPNNTEPVSTRNITINITFCGDFDYKLQNDTFIDVEDGGANNLKVTLKFPNGDQIPKDYWIQYNDTTNILFGFPDNNALSIGTRLYMLQATDSGGKRAVTYVNIHFNTTGIDSVYKTNEVLATTSCSEYRNIVPIDKVRTILEVISEEIQSSVKYIHLHEYSQIESNIVISFYTCTNATLSLLSELVNKDIENCRITDIVVKVKPSTTSTIMPNPSSSIIRTSSIVAPIINKPQVINSIPTITIICGQPLRYVIPEETFFDYQDGTTSNLNLTLLDENALERTKPYVEFYEKTAELYFLVTVSDCNKVDTDKALFIRATDSDGNFVMDSFTLLEIKEVASCCMYISATNNISITESSNKYLYRYFKALQNVTLYDDVNDELRIVSVSETDNAITNIVYTNKTFTNKTCFENRTKYLENVALNSNGTLLKTFQYNLSPFKTISAQKIVNQNCNDTNVTTIIPFLPPPSVGQFVDSEDWFLYLLPLFILAFMLLAICLCFYICRCCYRCCFGVTKEKQRVYHVDDFDEADIGMIKSYEGIPEDTTSVDSVLGDVKPKMGQSWDVPSEEPVGFVAPNANDDEPSEKMSSLIAPVEIREDEASIPNSIFDQLDEQQASRPRPNIASSQVSHVSDLYAKPIRRDKKVFQIYAKPIRRDKKVFQTSRNRSMRSRAARELNVSAPITTSYSTQDFKQRHHSIKDESTYSHSNQQSDYHRRSNLRNRQENVRSTSRRNLRLPAIPTGPPPPYSPPRKTRVVRRSLFPDYYERYVRPRRPSTPIAIPLLPTIIKSPRRSILIPRKHKSKKIVSFPILKKHRRHKHEKPIEVIEIVDSASDISTSATSTLRRYDSESSVEVKAILKGKGQAIRRVLSKRSPITYLNTRLKHKHKPKRQEKYEVERVVLPKRKRRLPKLEDEDIEVIRRHHPYKSYKYKFTEPYLYDYIPVRRKSVNRSNKRHTTVDIDDKDSDDEKELLKIRARLRQNKGRPTLDELIEDTDNEETVVKGRRRRLPLTNRKNRGKQSIKEQRKSDKEVWISLEDLNPEFK